MRQLAALLCLTAPLAAQDAHEAFFETHVRPLFAERCQACHGPQLQSGKLDLTKRDDVTRVANSGALVAALAYDGQVKMPPTGKLTAEHIAAVRQWVEDGAVWPEARATANEPGDHWAFEPIRPYDPPGAGKGWAQTAIDRFLASKLEAKGLQPAGKADKLVLLRRAKFGLHGLPPTLDEIHQFLADKQPGAFARLVGRLLAEPEYGEHWGRHWLDVARYADSTGVDEDHPYPHAWRYRDYVVEAFNEDLPYDQFVREQIAGDLLPAAEPGAINTRGIIATGFLGLGPKALAQRDPIQKKYDVVDEQIDTTTKTFLGLTVACSRCHDHKFDPILTSDYYAFASIFASTQSYEDYKRNGSESLSTPLVSEEEFRPYKEHRERVAALKRIRTTARRLVVERYRLEELIPHLAENMLAARNHTGEPRDRLKPYVAFFKPRPDSPSYLKPWHAAGDAGARAFANAQQRRLLEVVSTRVASLSKWLPEAEAQYRAGEKITAEMGDMPEDSLYTGLIEDGAPFALEDDEAPFPAETVAKLEAFDQEMKALEGSAPPQPPMANAVAEGDPVDQKIFRRGSYKNEGEPVAKRFPIVLAGEDQPPVKQGSGRLQLANWLVSKDNPLTARVIVNRVWQWHFGEGLVRTPSNFGKVGERPTHPELLDYLATWFVHNGWSIKKLHRLILSSSAYQMSTQVSDAAWDADPENRLWSRFARRRLSVEELRDSYLALSGRLDRTMGGTLDAGSGDIPEVQRNNRRLNPDDYDRRTLYIPLMRNKVPFMLGMFDFGDATTTMGRRTTSNVAPQALYLMNGEFASHNADGFAKQARAGSAPIERAYLAALTRKPTQAERQQAQDFLAQFPSADDAWRSFCKMLLASNEFHYVD